MDRKENNELPLDIYVPFVETLFRDGKTVAVGFAAQTLLVFLVYLNTSDPIYLGLLLALVFIAILRLHSIWKFNKAPSPTDREEAEARERIYIRYGALHGLAMGFFCFATIYWSPDYFGEIASICVTLASATSIAGRNYGSPRMVMIFIITFTGPISLGFIMRGDLNHIILGLLSIPLFFAVRRFAENVRNVLFEALMEKKKANSLAQRFNRALNTMSHGLVMFGTDGRVVVANGQAAEIMGFDNSRQLLGRTLTALLMRGTAAGLLRPEDSRFAEMQLTRALREGRDRKVLLELSDGRYLEFSAREGHDELGVITFEEVTQRVETEKKIRFMARYDSLTNLPNRAYFHEIVTECMAGGDPNRMCGLAVLDLDDFKSVNDSLGHPVGDGLIYAVAERIAAFADEDVRVSRFGGDEFMIFFNRLDDEGHLSRVLDEVFECIRDEIDVAGHVLRVEASGGAVVGRVRDNDVDAMVVKADLALYKAKELGKNGWRLFEPAMDVAFRDRQVMKSELRGAIEVNGLRVVYQPIVDMKTMRITSCEALCRWDHPELGPISPAVFIPLAEEIGIITEISSFVLKSACRQCARWPDHVGVSINLSAWDFRSRDVVEKVRAVLAETGLEPRRLEIEVTETALLHDTDATVAYIEELKALGVRIALDDFGTGYSSLSYLHTLPLDKVKIDGSFLVDIARSKRSLDLLKGVVGLSRTLGLSVTVEGVETFEQLRVLSSTVKPELAQGFLFGSALTGTGIETMSGKVWPFAKELKATEKLTAF